MMILHCKVCKRLSTREEILEGHLWLNDDLNNQRTVSNMPKLVRERIDKIVKRYDLSPAYGACYAMSVCPECQFGTKKRTHIEEFTALLMKMGVDFLVEHEDEQAVLRYIDVSNQEVTMLFDREGNHALPS
jgi:hypothetical protein